MDTQVARSLPTDVPDGQQLRDAVVRQRTPRTPHQKKDAQSTPRFFPVMKETKPIDNKVSDGIESSMYGMLLLDRKNVQYRVSSQGFETP